MLILLRKNTKKKKNTVKKPKSEMKKARSRKKKLLNCKHTKEKYQFTSNEK